MLIATLFLALLVLLSLLVVSSLLLLVWCCSVARQITGSDIRGIDESGQDLDQMFSMDDDN